MLRGSFDNSRQVNATTVVSDSDMDAARMIRSGQRYVSGWIFPGGSAFIRIFDAVRDGVAHQVQERIGNDLGQRFLDTDLTADDFERDFFAELTRSNSTCARSRSLENFVNRNQSQFD